MPSRGCYHERSQVYFRQVVLGMDMPIDNISETTAPRNDALAEMLSALPPEALRMDFLEPGSLTQRVDGTEHCKTVPYMIIAQVLQGAYQVTCPGAAARIGEGEAFLTPAHLPLRIRHRTDTPPKGLMRARWLHFHFSLYDTIDFGTLLHLPLRVRRHDAKALGDIIQELLDRPADHVANPFERYVRRQELGFKVLRIVCGISAVRASGIALLRSGPRLAPALRYLHEHLDQVITVAALANHAHMSVSHFHAFFRKHLGLPPMGYVKRVRLRRASELLVTTGLPVSTIAQHVGFANPFHFSREFKHHFSVPPTHYRRIHGSLLV